MLNEIDKQITALLAEDGRKSYREIGRQLGVSEGTIRNRVGRLVDQGLIRITVTGDMLAMGVGIVATVHLRVRPGTAEKVAKILAKRSNIRFVATAFGSADIIVQMMHRDTDGLHDFVNRELPEMAPDVTATETFQMSKVIKSAWTWGEWFEFQEK